MIDFRALCAELLQLEQEQPAEYTDWRRRYNAAIARVRTALAQPPSLKEQALEALAHILNNSSTQLGADTIRRALEQLDD
jgi:hypothetical protein